jgi:hypothetical protein
MVKISDKHDVFIFINKDYEIDKKISQIANNNNHRHLTIASEKIRTYCTKNLKCTKSKINENHEIDEINVSNKKHEINMDFQNVQA